MLKSVALSWRPPSPPPPSVSVPWLERYVSDCHLTQRQIPQKDCLQHVEENDFISHVGYKITFGRYEIDSPFEIVILLIDRCHS